MKIRLAVVILLLLPVIPSYAQDPHVHTKYLPSVKETKVYTDSMYVIDSPAQFMFVELVAYYPRQNLVKPSNKVFLKITSVTKQALYRKARHSKKMVKLATDGEVVPFDLPGYEELKGGSLNGQEVFFSDDAMSQLRRIFYPSEDGRVAYDVPVPKEAKIVNGKGLSGLVVERITISLNHKKLLRISGANRIEVTVGQTEFTFSDKQKNTIQDLAKRVSP